MLKVVQNLKKASIVLVGAFCLSAPSALLTGGGLATALSAGTIDTDVRVHPSLTLNLTNGGGSAISDINLNLDPSSNAFDYQDLNVSVGTNNAAGYTLTMSATDSDLVNVADSSKTIPTLATKSGGYTDSDFTTNAWGYKNGITNNYFPFNASGDTILSSATRANNDTTTLRFAAKIDYLKPSGLYEQNLNFTLTANMATYYMQDLDPAICSADPIEAIDTRDNNTYWVAKLADGNCWMLNNLQLGNKLATTTGSMTLTPANSNVSQDWVLTNKIVSPGIMPATPITDDVSSATTNIYNGDAFYCAPDGTNNYHSCYYNWFTATAGSGTSQVTGKDTDGIDVNDSICPRGWVLPKGGTSSENNFQGLYQAMGSPSATDILVNPVTAVDNTSGTFKPGFLLNGGYAGGGHAGGGTAGTYWSRTAYSTGRTYRLRLSDSAVLTQNSDAKYGGSSVRCLRETRKIYDIDNMQDISPAIVANTNNESATTLKDTRDNQEYTVAKLKDGKVWMTQNLRLGTSGSVNLTPMDSNISSNWTLDGKNASPGNFPTPTSCPLSTCEDRYTEGTYYYDNNAYYCTPDSSNYYVGCYYDWYSATAGAGTHNTTPVGGSVGYKDVNSSICPKGWYLPTSASYSFSDGSNDRTNSDFSMLRDNYLLSDTRLVDNPTTTYNNTSGLPRPGFLLGGMYNSSGARNLGAYGYYWSRSAYSKGTAYALVLGEETISVRTRSYKSYGISVRCLAY